MMHEVAIHCNINRRKLILASAKAAVSYFASSKTRIKIIADPCMLGTLAHSDGMFGIKMLRLIFRHTSSGLKINEQSKGRIFIL